MAFAVCDLTKIDEYTRISTPRSEVLFKKGYLMREKKYAGPTSMMPMTTTSSNDSGSVSVVSNEETASYYSIQSMSPDNSTYQNGSDTSPAYPNDGFEPDLSSLVYSSGFYDNSGYFYVNRKLLITLIHIDTILRIDFVFTQLISTITLTNLMVRLFLCLMEVLQMQRMFMDMMVTVRKQCEFSI